MKSRRAISNTVFAAVTIILVMVAALGFGLYLTMPRTVTVTKPVIMNQTVTKTIYLNRTIYVNRTITIPEAKAISGAFLNSQVITFNYTAQFMCTPNLIQFFPNQTQANQVAMGCEVGAVNSSAFPANAAPVYVVVPAFAGISIFGVQQLGANPLGFPVFHYNGQNYTVVTQCGAAGTPTACPDHMTYIYSPAFTAVEQSLGIKNGVFGLPEGVLPTPAHEHVVTFSTNTSIPWYVVVVLDFNPNIFPNPVTGQCQAIVPSNQSSPTGLCLNSYSNVQKALHTYDSAVMTANQANPIWSTLLKSSLDAVEVPSNMVLYFSDPSTYPYPL
ncbi:hypothetical protein HS1genome_1427 [Sulfodiicoccus acidiphilus]|uniref:Uncharacterized protein n=1 Tax=Sulfodiicoccus acidiphilus TaxID=1670455 RepID=A0A348B4D6_9CREN|nr:hypothetical protein [Sulfodiicoccus acidiphilus]BBD73038.1 hypothetical protein HS1genome_1427 [Sulfodiicoccus acidiphilus]GGU05650.1 hypothetical protein GCM10007116_22520 [Sulfodiicoccus acidiphilus]